MVGKVVLIIFCISSCFCCICNHSGNGENVVFSCDNNAISTVSLASCHLPELTTIRTLSIENATLRSAVLDLSPSIVKLTFTFCSFESSSVLDTLLSLKNVINVAFYHCNGVDITKVLSFPKLVNLTVSFSVIRGDFIIESDTLTALDLRGQLLRSLETVKTPAVRHLRIDSNLFTSISSIARVFPNLTELRIANNSLPCVNDEELLYLKSISKLYLGGNPWRCDGGCSMPKVVVALGHSIDDMENIRCNGTGTNVLFWGWGLCEGCACFVARHSVEVDCSANGTLTHLPPRLPPLTKVVRLANNRLRTLSFASNTERVRPSGWEEVMILDVSANHIESSFALEGSMRLLKPLLALNLSYNRLHHIPVHVLQQMDREKSPPLQYLFLRGNPWQCDCNAVPFSEWLQIHKEVQDVEEVRCSNFPHERLYAASKVDLCPQSMVRIHWLDVTSVVMGFMIVVIICKMLVDSYRQRRSGKLPQFWRL